MSTAYGTSLHATLATPTNVIARINDIYDALRVLPNIREHMARVAAVTLELKRHWRGPPGTQTIDWDEVVAVALLHDVGNIVKVRFDSPEGQEMLGPEICEDLEEWQAVQRDVVTRFGADEYAATGGLLATLPLAPALRDRLLDAIPRTGFSKGDRALVDEDWTVRLVAYADRVVGPYGVLSFEGRLRESAERYGHPFYAPHERPPLVRASYALRDLVQTCVGVPLDDITDDAVREDVQRFLRRD